MRTNFQDIIAIHNTMLVSLAAIVAAVAVESFQKKKVYLSSLIM